MVDHANDDDVDDEAEVQAGDDVAVEVEANAEDAQPEDASPDEGEAEGDNDDAEPGEITVDPETWDRYMRITEALLYASSEPMSERMLANRLPEDADVKGLLKALRNIYGSRGVNLVRAGSSWAFRTAPDLTD